MRARNCNRSALVTARARRRENAHDRCRRHAGGRVPRRRKPCQARRGDDVARLTEATATPRVVCSSGKSFVALGLLALSMPAVALLVPMEWPVRILLAAIARVALAASIVLHRLTRQPILMLTAAGVVFSRSTACIPWSDVRDHSALLVNGNLSPLRLEPRRSGHRSSPACTATATTCARRRNWSSMASARWSAWTRRNCSDWSRCTARRRTCANAGRLRAEWPQAAQPAMTQSAISATHRCRMRRNTVRACASSVSGSSTSTA